MTRNVSSAKRRKEDLTKEVRRRMENKEIAKYIQYMENPDIEKYVRARIKRAVQRVYIATGISIAAISLITAIIIG